MEMAQNSERCAERFESRRRLKEEQVPLIKNELKYFKNEKFKQKVAVLCQWCVLQLSNFIMKLKMHNDLIVQIDIS